MAGRCLVILVFLLWSSAAFAADYGIFVSVEDEDDLLELLNAGQIDEEAYQALLEMMHDPIDLNEAGRELLASLPNLTYSDVDAILEYRKQVETIASLEALVAANVLDAEKVRALRPFVVVRPKPLVVTVHGKGRYSVASVLGEEGTPPMAVRLRLQSAGGFGFGEAGIAGLVSRNRVHNVQFDETRQVLVADPPSAKFYLPKFFLAWEKGSLHVIAGTFRVGFGQRLTLDNTGLERPKGARPDDSIVFGYDLSVACKESSWDLQSPCTGSARYQYESPDFRWTDRFRGLALSLTDLDAGPGQLEVHAFGSYQTHSIYQYEIYDKNACPDPTDDENPACAAPPVLRWRGDPLAQTTRFSYQTLPDMYNQWTAGGNISYVLDARTSFGVTGYGAQVHWLVKGISLDFQEWSRTPYGGPFGAVGAYANFGIGPFDIATELARSFDSQPAGGGLAGLVRVTTSFGQHEIETLLRYYHLNYANPYARPPSEPDEYDGLPARDEAGFRVKYFGKIHNLSLRSMLDLWTGSADLEGPIKMKFRMRADYKWLRWFTPGAFIEYHDKDLKRSGRGYCYEETYEEISGEPVPCAGERVQAGIVFRFKPIRNLVLSATYQHRFVDDNRTKENESGERYYVFGDRFRQDLLTWLGIAYKPLNWLSLRFRFRYLNEDLSDPAYLEESLWGYAEVAVKVKRAFFGRLRYEIYKWLDERKSTLQREPNPAHWLRAEIEYRF